MDALFIIEIFETQLSICWSFRGAPRRVKKKNSKSKGEKQVLDAIFLSVMAHNNNSKKKTDINDHHSERKTKLTFKSIRIDFFLAIWVEDRASLAKKHTRNVSDNQAFISARGEGHCFTSQRMVIFQFHKNIFHFNWDTCADLNSLFFLRFSIYALWSREKRGANGNEPLGISLKIESTLNRWRFRGLLSRWELDVDPGCQAIGEDQHLKLSYAAFLHFIFFCFLLLFLPFIPLFAWKTLEPRIQRLNDLTARWRLLRCARFLQWIRGENKNVTNTIAAMLSLRSPLTHMQFCVVFFSRLLRAKQRDCYHCYRLCLLTLHTSPAARVSCEFTHFSMCRVEFFIAFNTWLLDVLC